MDQNIKLNVEVLIPLLCDKLSSYDTLVVPSNICLIFYFFIISFIYLIIYFTFVTDGWQKNSQKITL